MQNCKIHPPIYITTMNSFSRNFDIILNPACESKFQIYFAAAKLCYQFLHAYYYHCHYHF